MKHWKAPHHDKGHDGPFDGIGMHIGHEWRSWTLDQQKRSIATVGQSGRLRKQPPVNQGRDEIADRLSLYQHFVVNQVVAGAEVDHPNIECAAPTCRLEQRRVPFGMIDGESMGLS